MFHSTTCRIEYPYILLGELMLQMRTVPELGNEQHAVEDFTSKTFENSYLPYLIQNMAGLKAYFA